MSSRCRIERNLIGLAPLPHTQNEVVLVIEVHELGCHLNAESAAFTTRAVKNDLHICLP